ncbi:SiaB family protein kinase [Salidesulfovibrio brasiliensis]|uniref:SiaB family protein kinase n=1 Tax=Salidesulfovibrio brasiliensis TaxID=221711 RepID=UPI0006D17BB7|nr:SiaB family protein kinase [Salidesulfovibrio brasiliensis]
MTPKMYDCYESLMGDGIILYFNGPVSQGVVEGVADLMRQRLRNEEAGMKLSHRIFAILVEQMQNIVRYSKEREPVDVDGESIANGQVIVGREDDGRYFVACGNRIAAADGDRLSEKLNRVSSMNKEELKRYYKDCRRRGPDPDSKGAGLGFIEMARKAEGPLDYHIRPVDGETAFFSMKVVA